MKNGDLKIDRGIPIPTGGYMQKSPLMKTMEKMKVGDSFLWPMKSRTRLAQYAIRAKIKIITRTDGDTQVRVWRVK